MVEAAAQVLVKSLGARLKRFWKLNGSRSALKPSSCIVVHQTASILE